MDPAAAPGAIRSVARSTSLRIEGIRSRNNHLATMVAAPAETFAGHRPRLVAPAVRAAFPASEAPVVPNREKSKQG